jgi:hypothetical protein
MTSSSANTRPSEAERQAARRRLLALIEELHALPGEPMTLEEIQKEVAEVRREMRAARVESSA